ncbi:hypothetical protein D5F01_LYC25126 [Larimichthys crocea]|uniref:Uncharacterized protein n=1 Tax=Larimichthys crocea TaxID=215358 RepID=A0A6G0HDL2_LARCR|nr:hypothetical protein D5F01_LYC25126 [Larimichthys crocea]
MAHQLYSSVVATTPLFLKMGTITLILHSSSIFSLSKILLNNPVKKCTAISPRHFHTSTGISSGPSAFPLFILFNALLTSSSLTVTSSALRSLSFSSFINSSKYSFHLPITLLAPVSTLPSLSLIILTCCTSFPSLSLCLANLYRSVSGLLTVQPSIQVIVSSLFGLCHFNSHLMLHLPVLLSTLFSPLSASPGFSLLPLPTNTPSSSPSSTNSSPISTGTL